MSSYNKQEIKEALSDSQIFELLEQWGGEPEYCPTGIISRTICHNHPSDHGSKKLYYYSNSKLFTCYTGCENNIFDIYELLIKVMTIQKHYNYSLYNAVKWIVNYFHLTGFEQEDQVEEELEDWKILENYDRIQNIKVNTEIITLKEYDINILDKFNYNIHLTPWLNEDIAPHIIEDAQIGYYVGTDQITIPHFDIDNRFIGLRGRYMSEEDCLNYGKYRPIRIGNITYSHPLGLNLYNLNNSKNNIKQIKKAIVLEGEKSVLKYRSYFGINNDISVACCGSNLSAYQIQLLLNAGAEEIIIAFDRQFQKIGDNEFNLLKRKLLSIYTKYKNYAVISFIFDKNMITGYKDAPIDCGIETFLTLYKNRIIL